MNPKYWPSWERHFQPQALSHAWFKVGRRNPSQIKSGLPVIVLGTGKLGILATGETTSAAEFRADPDWAEVALDKQAESKRATYRVQIQIRALDTQIMVEHLKRNPMIARLPNVARETITWLPSDQYNALLSLIREEG